MLSVLLHEPGMFLQQILQTLLVYSSLFGATIKGIFIGIVNYLLTV